MTIYSIGFTQRSAENFFTTLKSAGIRRLVLEYLAKKWSDLTIVHL